jgi:chorismate dehydratase
VRVCAVSYLNTVPLVWGLLHGPQRDRFELDFQVPAGCAEEVASGAADIGIIPSFELTRMDLEIIPGTGIACRGPVRSILLISSRPAEEIRTLALDASSRTSAQLARIILERRYGTTPNCISHPPDLEAMLRVADAALVIGDPALRIEPARLPYYVYDLGAEWVQLTGLPMVFALWAGRKETVTPEITEVFRASWEYGRERMEDLVAQESARREFPRELVREYLTRHIVHELGPKEFAGMKVFLQMAKEVNRTAV